MNSENIGRIDGPRHPLWREFWQLHKAAFQPKLRDESSRQVADAAKAGTIQIYGYANSREDLCGYYILQPLRHCVFWSFMAVRQENRGTGLGRLLLTDLMERFRREHTQPYLLLDAEDHPAAIWGKLGCRRVDIPFAIPDPEGEELLPMHLMLRGRGPEPSSIKARIVREMVRELYENAYPDCPETLAPGPILEGLPERVALLPWPPPPTPPEEEPS